MTAQYDKTRIQFRKGSAAEWSAANPVLSSGEPGYAVDTSVLKIGNGVTAWNSLSAYGGGGGISQEDLDDAISNLIDSAPDTLNTLNEIAAAINDNASFFEAVAYSGGNISQFNNDSKYVASGDNVSLLVNDAGYLTSESNNLTSSVTWANVPDANITESSVVQHSGALEITESQIVDLQSYLLNIVEDTTPQLGGDLGINTHDITGTGNISISGDITAISGTLDVLSFNVNNESVLTKGQISWDDTEGTMDIGLTNNTSIHVGEHRYFRIRNETGDILYKGQVVYATGVHSNGLITPAKYVADGSIREVRFMGVVLENVNNQNNGYVVDFGHLENMDLDGSATNYAVGDETWLAGDILYVHPTQAGKLTNVEPKHSIAIAIILDTGNGNGAGKMFVRPTSYGHINDMHDVNTSGVANLDGLVYNSSTDYWEPKHVVQSETAGITGASGVNNIVIISQSDYDNIVSPDANTIYYII